MFGTESKYKLENLRIQELGSQFYIRGINQFTEKCSKYPLFNALNPTMMIVCDRLVNLFSQEVRQEGFNAKQFFLNYLPEIKQIFNARNVNNEKLLQDIIVYFSHLSHINKFDDPPVTEEVEDLDESDFDEDGVYQDDAQYDDGGEYF